MALRAYYLYHSDDGNTYRVFIPVWLGSFTGNPFGFSADNPADAQLPRKTKMRYVTAKDASTGRHRKVHCGTVSATAWVTLGVAYTLPNIDGTSESYTTDGRVGERTRG